MAAVLVVRLDSAGDVLCAGPAVRAVAASGRRVVFLAGPQGAEAARLLPGADEVVVWACPWIVAAPGSVEDADIHALIAIVRGLDVDEALILTSFHQSPLPTALVLRMAGVRRISAISEDYPGSLLDLRVADPGDVPEPVRMLGVARAAGFELPSGDDGGLAVSALPPVPAAAVFDRPYVVLHPGSAASSRAWSPYRCAEAVQALDADGWAVAVTGTAGEHELAGYVAGDTARDLSGMLTLGQLGSVLSRAAAVVVGNTGPAHLAAAVRVPVVSLFAPVVPLARWAPYTRDRVVLGDQRAACAGTRATRCPVEGHPCLDSVTA
ncbi:MAG: glycosyl transferase family 9, partial [Jatrophihabitantaceae bacterium]|nr:glycosyl transferase family 9 [Jatrophihabitantaceae bacterium]